MDDLNPSDRLALSYPVPENFRRTWIYLLCALICCLACIFVKFPTNAPVVVSGQDLPVGPPMLKIVVGFVSAVLVLSAILDTIFVLTYKYFKKEISFDQANLYIDLKESETVVPLGNVTTIALDAYMVQNNIRGSYYTYAISYNEYNEEKKVTVNVYFRKTTSNLEMFKQRVQEKNPSVYIKTWSSNSDGLIRWFQKKRDS